MTQRRDRPTDSQPCRIDDCGRPRRQGYRLCPMHRYRMKHHGTTEPFINCHAPLKERFERFVVRGPECWGWTGGTNNHGYARMSKIYAHRISYELTFGTIPEGLHVLHRCDNPPCTNPSHLMLGTHQDNMDDMKRKGRANSKNRAVGA